MLAGAVLLGAAHVGVSWNKLLVVEEMVARVLLRVGNPVGPEALASALGKKGNLVLAPFAEWDYRLAIARRIGSPSGVGTRLSERIARDSVNAMNVNIGHARERRETGSKTGQG